MHIVLASSAQVLGCPAPKRILHHIIMQGASIAIHKIDFSEPGHVKKKHLYDLMLPVVSEKMFFYNLSLNL